ncbi:hypothetical protein [Halalkalibacter oceani]|uniref:hypothetical protein n=1 Tax=Halalkalibacter oceani TaxID=1653776 RepID=UPI00339A7883
MPVYSITNQQPGSKKGGQRMFAEQASQKRQSEQTKGLLLGLPYRFAIWKEGECIWLHEEEWEVFMLPCEALKSLHIMAYHPRWELQITLLYSEESAALSTISLKNQSHEIRELRFLIHLPDQAGAPPELSFVSPSQHVILQYSKEAVSLVGARFFQQAAPQVSVGVKDDIWEGESGKLAISPLSKTSGECMMLMPLVMTGYEEACGQLWNLEAKSEEDVWASYQRQILANSYCKEKTLDH